MSEDTSNMANKKIVKKAAPKKAAPRTKTATAKPTASKSAVKKTAAKAKTTATKSAKPRAKAAAKKSTASTSAVKVVEEKTTADAKKQSKDAASTATKEDNAHFDAGDADKTNSSHNKQDASQIIDDLKERDWPQIIKRALLMFFFGVLGSFALYLSFVLAVAQVGFSIFVGQPNQALTRVMRQCAAYIRDVLEYLSFGSDECPFPFGRDLPEVD